MQLAKIMALIVALRGAEATNQGMRLAHPPLKRLIVKERMMMRRVDTLIIHCSATKAGMDIGATDIDRWHREQGMAGIGYHYVIRLDGSVEEGRSVAEVGAHCLGWNVRSIGICYIGGLDAAGRPADTRTELQKEALERLVKELKQRYPIERVIGHRDTSPDLNGNGVVEPNEFVKSCPCFDVQKWLKQMRMFLLVSLLSLLLWACGSRRVTGQRRAWYDTTSVVHRREAEVERQQVLQEVCERMEERIEQTVVHWGGAGELPSSLVRTVVERKQGTEVQAQSETRVERTDSAYTTFRAAAKEDTKEEIRQKPTGVWHWVLLIAAILIVGIGGVCAYLYFR